MRYVLILLLGLVIGAGAAVFLLGGYRTKAMPGRPVEAPTSAEASTDNVIVTVGKGFFDELLTAVFRDLDPPAFNLAEMDSGSAPTDIRSIAFQQGCINSITLLQEGSNNRTQVQFSGGKISAPLAFSGSYKLMGNCMQIKGWAETSINLRFDQEKQTVYGQVNVEGVTLEGVNPLANSLVTVFVRNAIDQRVNPLELIRAPQLQLMIPVKASNGSLKAHVKDVRAEVLDGSLKLYISYEFSGARAG
jgi:hypothetical protein